MRVDAIEFAGSRRKQFLADIIRRVKTLAIDPGVSAFSFVDKVTTEFLARSVDARLKD